MPRINKLHIFSSLRAISVCRMAVISWAEFDYIAPNVLLIGQFFYHDFVWLEARIKQSTLLRTLLAHTLKVSFLL